MKFKALIGLPLAAAGAAGLAMALPGAAFAQGSGSTTYTAALAPVPLNGATSASGTVTLVLSGSQATITEQVSGLDATFMGAPYPHVQHIHGGAQGVCPTASADANGDKVISTTEGAPSYGPIQTTLSVSGDTTPASGTNLKIAPSGASFNYHRTITLDAATMASLTSGKAVVVVHGLNPATAAPAATTSKSELVPSLPLAATSPALCGTLTASQMSATPSGAPATGGGSTSGTQDLGLFALGALLLLGGTSVLIVRHRHSARS
jgi:CHRD domain